jgi:hypothetical protein
MQGCRVFIETQFMRHTTHILTTGIVFLLLAAALYFLIPPAGQRGNGLRGLARRAARVFCSFFFYSGMFLLMLAFLA